MRIVGAVLVVMMVGCGANTAGIGPLGGGKGTGGSGAGGTGGSGAGGSNGGGSAGQGGGTGGSGAGGTGGGASDGCSDAAKIVYVVDTDGTLSSFDPMTKTFTNKGTLSCSSIANPFSMAVARDAFAYVLYDDGELFRVNTNDLSCTATSFAASSSFTQFGMGFSTDTVGGTTDSLFIGGGQAVGSMSTLAKLDTGTFMPTTLGNINGWPELTGTGDAKLWGFFPGVGGATPFVAEINKTNAQLGTTFNATALSGNPEDWAFAFWGGSFWIFLKIDTDPSTQVWQMNAMTGSVTKAVPDTGRHIVGAGVSTCAPVTIN